MSLIDVQSATARPAVPPSGLRRSCACDDVQGRFDQVELRDGRSVLLQPISPQDADAEQAFISALSPTSRYRRFHFGLHSLSPQALQLLTQVDQASHVAFAAREPDVSSPGAPLVADARYVRQADSAAAEFAITVADAWQGAGLGGELLARLLQHARDHGALQLFGDVLWGNQAMLALVKSLCGEVLRHPNDATLLRVRFTLNRD